MELNTPFEQVISVKFSTEAEPLFINLVYRSPNSSAKNNEELNDFIKISKSSSLTIWDMNYSGIDWENGCSDSISRNFFDSTQYSFLRQHVDFPTHDGNILELVLSTNDI